MGQNSTEVAYGFGQLGSGHLQAGSSALTPPTGKVIVAITFLDRVTKESVIEVNGINEDKYEIVDDVVYLYCPSSFGKTKLTNSVIEKKLKATATTRNLKTTIKLLELATT